MSDYDTILGILQKAEIPYEVKDGVITVTHDGSSDKVIGYMHFLTEFVFDPADGSLKEIGVWE